MFKDPKGYKLDFLTNFSKTQDSEVLNLDCFSSCLRTKNLDFLNIFRQGPLEAIQLDFKGIFKKYF